MSRQERRSVFNASGGIAVAIVAITLAGCATPQQPVTAKSPLPRASTAPRRAPIGEPSQQESREAKLRSFLAQTASGKTVLAERPAASDVVLTTIDSYSERRELPRYTTSTFTPLKGRTISLELWDTLKLYNEILTAHDLPLLAIGENASSSDWETLSESLTFGGQVQATDTGGVILHSWRIYDKEQQLLDILCLAAGENGWVEFNKAGQLQTCANCILLHIQASPQGKSDILMATSVMYSRGVSTVGDKSRLMFLSGKHNGKTVSPVLMVDGVIYRLGE